MFSINSVDLVKKAAVYTVCLGSVYKTFGINELEKLDTRGGFSAILYKADNFCDFPFAFLHNKASLKGVYSKRKYITPTGSQFFRLE